MFSSACRARTAGFARQMVRATEARRRNPPISADDVSLQSISRGRPLDVRWFYQLRQPLFPSQRRGNLNIYDAAVALCQIAIFKEDIEKSRRVPT